MSSPLPVITNNLISVLAKKDRKKILSQCETVELCFGDILNEARQPFNFVYFPLSGFISLLSTLEGSEALEIGLIGNEGMLGATLALDIDTTIMQSIVQGSGKSLRLTTSQFRTLLNECPSLKNNLSHYSYIVMEQLIQSATCAYFHSVELRLARWLLMTDDRAHNQSLQLTHQFLAKMLGVRRSGVTIAAGKLQKRKLIHYSRGQISILDRKGLEAASCQCYENMKQAYSQYIADQE